MNVPNQSYKCSGNRNNGTERLARDREPEHCSVPVSRSVSARSVPIGLIQVVDAYLAAHVRKRKDAWTRDELMTLVGNYLLVGQKATAKLLPGRSVKGVDRMATRLKLQRTGQFGPMPRGARHV